MKSLSIIVAMCFTVLAIQAECPNKRHSCSSAQQTSCGGVRIGGCCKKRQVWDRQSPRPELNPPDDIASLPEREQRRFLKMFKLVPDQIKVKSVQCYAQRQKFMNSCQYRQIMQKLDVKLSRMRQANEPAVTSDEVRQMCRDIIVYGRSLIMGRMEECPLVELARRYGFKKTAKFVEKVEDCKNFRHGLSEGYPCGDQECQDFEMLAKTFNPAQWNAFKARLKTLNERYAICQAGGSLSCGKVASKALYDRYEDNASRPIPDDLCTLPKRQTVRIGKIYDLLPAQVLSYAQRTYSQRVTYLTSGRYQVVKQKLAEQLKKNIRKLEADPRVGMDDVLKMCDEVLRFGRPLVFGDMRHVSLVELARQYNFPAVEKFLEKVEDDNYLLCGTVLEYNDTSSEFRDFESMARMACIERWKALQKRLGAPKQIVTRR